jgi:hypothetical protein
MLRMASMVITLAVLGMLIMRSRDPQTWVWLTGDQSSVLPEEKQAETRKIAAAQTKADQTKATNAKAEAEAKPAEPVSPVTPGPTDLDDAEQESAIEEFQALTDRSMKLGPEEMPAYWRMFGWVQHQPFAELQKRSTKDVPMNEFVQSTDDQRGRLVTLDLNVRRVLSYDAPKNPAGIKKVYEIWGWTTESKAWLYCVVTPHLPPGMPVGSDVYEKVKFSGYFLKLQGYEAAGAGPDDKPLIAPLLVGRVAWQKSPLTKPEPVGMDPTWLIWGGGAVAVFILGRIAIWFWGRGRRTEDRPRVVRSSTDPADVEDWLARAEKGENKSIPDPDYPEADDMPRSNGYDSFSHSRHDLN